MSCRGLCNVRGEKNDGVMRVRVAGAYVTSGAEKNDRVMRVRVAGVYVTQVREK